jgi:hypothetical protein
MKRKIILLSFMLFSMLGLKAQVKTIYYLGEKVMLDTTLASSLATSFAIYGKLTNDSLYSFKRYDIRNNLMITGSFKDEALSIPHGKFTYYSDVETFNDTHNTVFPYADKNIFVSEEGQYDNGLSIGKWIGYYPDGKIFATVNFQNGLKQGEFVAYDENGRVQTFGIFKDDKKEGEWLLKRGKKKIFYVNDIEQKKVSGKIKTN